MEQAKSRRKLLVLSGLLIAAALIVALMGGITAWRQYQADKRADKLAAQQEGGGDAPSTDKPSSSDFANYRVPADQPRYVYIPKIGVRAMVKPTWLTTAGAIGTPTNIYNTAWYVHSAKPGQAGAMLIDGHVGFWTKHGVFFNLKELHAGDAIKVERGDGKTLSYKVVKTKFYPYDKVDMPAVLAPVTAGKPGLNLITCTGDVTKGTNQYDQRVVVFAEQL